MLQKHHDQNKVTSLVAGRQKDCVEDVDHAVPVSGGTTGRKSLDWFQARCNWETPGNPLGGQTMRSLAGVLSVMFMAAMAVGQTTEAKPPKLYNAALTELGASAKGTGAPFNRDWPANGALAAGEGRGGTIFGAPMTGGRVDIHLIIPVDVKAVEVIQLKYYNTQIPKAIDIFVEGKLVKHVELANKPNEAQRVELETRGQNVGILVTDVYPPSTYTDDTGKPRVVNFGGWSRLRVLTTTNMADLVKAPVQYNVPLVAANIAPTSGSLVEGKIEVSGRPRQSRGHPCTMWDKEDIAHYQEMLKTSKELQAQFAALKKEMDSRITRPVRVPPPQKDAKGNWRHISDEEDLDNQKIGAIHNQLSLDVANLGELFALSGEAKYADSAKKILLAYADAYPKYGVGARPGFNHSPSKAFDQTLGDATWLIPVATGYDLIHDAPSITPEERRHIEENIIKAAAREIISNHAMIEAATNWSAIACCAVLAAGYATDDHELINTGMYGIGGTQERPTGGLFQKHFTEAISKDGLWTEGSMGYQFMALCALIADAEFLWHHGIDMYSYNDYALKRLFDSPLEYSYPDMTTPALHDGGHAPIICPEAFLYEYAYRRYHDPKYLLILNQAGRHLDMHFQQYVVSVIYDRDNREKSAAPEWKSVNYFGVGYGILRTTDSRGTTSLLLEYGPAGSHSHPDKLCLDLYAFNDQLMIDPGTVWYEDPMYKKWYYQTFAHNTLVVDELSQVLCGGKQLVYAPAGTMGLERASCVEAYPGVVMDRATFLTSDYMADLFGAFTRLPRKFDLAWHMRGRFASDLELGPYKFPEPCEPGYEVLDKVRHAAPTDKAWSATVTCNGNPARFLAAGGAETEVFVGDGFYGMERPPTIVQRRQKGSTIYGNVIDISGGKEAFVRSVSQEGSLEAGYGLLKIETARGTDVCFSAYRPGLYKAGGLETDALQAHVVMDGQAMKAMCLGGGKMLKTAGAALERSEPGLAYLERVENGAYLLANPSPSEATVTVTFAPLGGMEIFHLDAQGRRSSAAAVRAGAGGSFAVPLKAGARVEFSPKGAASFYDQRQALLKKRQADQEAVLTKARDECVARTKAREAEATAKPLPANTVICLMAKAFSGQGGGQVGVTKEKRAVASDACINMWDKQGHWLEWTFDLPAEGYYHLTLCYCSELDQGERELKVNGEVQEPFAPLLFPATGGWANGSDDWRLWTAMNPTNGKPLLLKFKQGKNVVRLTNVNGRGVNVDYLAVTSPDVRVNRDLPSKKIHY